MHLIVFRLDVDSRQGEVTQTTQASHSNFPRTHLQALQFRRYLLNISYNVVLKKNHTWARKV
jgi:hypothetical protein